MSRFRLLIEYEGSNYHGWQQNAGVKTIQGEMLKACQQLFNTKKIELYGAGRLTLLLPLPILRHLSSPKNFGTPKGRSFEGIRE